MLVAQAVALFVDRNREAVKAEYENLFKEWKSDCVSVRYARSNARADVVRWIEQQIGLSEDQRAEYDQLQDVFTMRFFVGGVSCMTKKMAKFYGDAEYTGAGLVLEDELIKTEEVARIGANKPGRLHPVQMAEKNTRAGYHFFDDDTMKFFQSIIETSCTDHGAFITSERYDTGLRHYRVRVFCENGKVITVSEQIGTRKHAQEIMLIVDALISRNK
ncbi:hypothetical protein KIMCHI1738_96 [Corynebacterium phage Kimchi1738]|uniref:Uncharacterized protein n=1 Tax=Corynebacterium phage Kimchi1738 TaxID=2483719 RepID=A0A3G3LXR5_9CAUD|nr:hypothetical protein KNU16_gp48 [Corynebacterium phage Kimchi1738]AYQ98483.1 hypothetical protein KIMCHI1738_96 [Corynebacterium phage Kimchi1738]